jgi:hypothetical protein
VVLDTPQKNRDFCFTFKESIEFLNFAKNSKNFDFAKKSEGRTKLIPQYREEGVPQKIEIPIRVGLVFGELSVVQTVSQLAPVNKHIAAMFQKLVDERRSMCHNSGPDA